MTEEPEEPENPYGNLNQNQRAVANAIVLPSGEIVGHLSARTRNRSFGTVKRGVGGAFEDEPEDPLSFGAAAKSPS